MSRQIMSETSITRITSETSLANQDSIAAAKITGSSWYTGTTMLMGRRRPSAIGRYRTAGIRLTSQNDHLMSPSTPSGVPST